MGKWPEDQSGPRRVTFEIDWSALRPFEDARGPALLANKDAHKQPWPDRFRVSKEFG